MIKEGSHVCNTVFSNLHDIDKIITNLTNEKITGKL